MLVRHWTESTSSSYDQVVSDNLDSPNNNFDVTQFAKAAIFFVQIQQATKEFKSTMLQKVPRVDRHFLDEQIELLSEGSSRFAFVYDSTASHVVKFVQFINLLYISIACPLTIGFNVTENKTLIVLDAVSIAISFAVIIVKLRTYVLVHGRKTLNVRVVLRNYLQKGLVIDLFGLIPFKLVLYNFHIDRDHKMHIWFSVLSLARMVSVWRIAELI